MSDASGQSTPCSGILSGNRIIIIEEPEDPFEVLDVEKIRKLTTNPNLTYLNENS